MTEQHGRGLRALFTGLALLLAAATTACSGGGSQPESAPPTSASPSVTGSPTDVRGRLVTALQVKSPIKAKLVADPRTALTPRTADWLAGWQILDVLNRTPPHPQRFYAALSTDGRAEVLTGAPHAFSTVLVDAGVKVDSAERAAAIGSAFLDTTQDFRANAYRIDSVDDIRWIPNATAAEQHARNELAKTYRDRVQPPQVVESADGWRVTIWMVQGRDLVTHELDLASGAPVVDSAETVERDIPVPYSA